MRILITVSFCLVFFSNAFSQSASVQDYISKYKDVAIREMKRKGVPASIILAQGILETESGKSDLVIRSNNHFGIKCKANWKGESVYHDDDERGECFRKYDSAEDSYRDHSDFLSNSSRYASLFTLDPKDYKAWAHGLKKAGYATNPKYPQILISSIERYGLARYTEEALSSKEQFASGSYITPDEQVKTVSMAAIPEEKRSPEVIGNNKIQKHNGLKAVYAEKGTSLLAIASRADVPLSKLMSWNDLSTDGLLPSGQWIYLEKKNETGDAPYYTTAVSESLWAVSQTTGVQLNNLSELNAIDAAAILQAGTKIKLRQAGLMQEENSTASIISSNIRYHEVVAKEGLYAISRKYNVSVQELREWNSLTTDNLKIGQQLIISK